MKGKIEGNLFRFKCPGCKHPHHVPFGNPQVWTWNLDLDRPTISPSILNTWERFDKDKTIKNRCHLFVRNGFIQYLSDCTHELKGKTIEMLEWDGNRE